MNVVVAQIVATVNTHVPLSHLAGPSLIFPTYGSEFTIKAKATLPYSLINGTYCSIRLKKVASPTLVDLPTVSYNIRFCNTESVFGGAIA